MEGTKEGSRTARYSNAVVDLFLNPGRLEG
jgi:hypothetical protein